MAQLEILEIPDPRLRTIAKPVEQVDDGLRQLMDDMLETMYASYGIGLAATQVNVDQRLLVLDVSGDQTEPRVFINPEILQREGSKVHEEGCLSVPGIYAKVQRAERVRVRALDQDGNAFEEEVDGLLAVCLQHEIDHLDGKLFVDHLSPLKRQMVLKKLEKLRRQQEPASVL